MERFAWKGRIKPGMLRKLDLRRKKYGVVSLMPEYILDNERNTYDESDGNHFFP